MAASSTGRDVVIAAMLGAEEFGIGTASAGRHGLPAWSASVTANTCPVGICSQDDGAAKAKFSGTPEKVVNLFSVHRRRGARDPGVRLGFRSLTGDHRPQRSVVPGQPRQRVSRRPRLEPASRPQADPGASTHAIAPIEGRNEVPDTLDAQIDPSMPAPAC